MTLAPEIIPFPQDVENAEFYLDSQLRDIVHALTHLHLTSRQGDIQHGDKVGNLDARYVVYTSNAVADTEDTISHGLGRVPVGYIPAKQDKAGTVYDGTTAWTATHIYLRASAASMALTVMVL